MRKFFSIVFYVFAGIFTATIMLGSFQDITHDGNEMKIRLAIITIFTTISILFFALASWIYPSKNWQKPTAITLFLTVGLSIMGMINNYFIIKDMRNLNLKLTEAQEILKGEEIAYDLPLGLLVSLVLLAIATLLYRKSLKI